MWLGIGDVEWVFSLLFLFTCGSWVVSVLLSGSCSARTCVGHTTSIAARLEAAQAAAPRHVDLSP